MLALEAKKRVFLYKGNSVQLQNPSESENVNGKCPWEERVEGHSVRGQNGGELPAQDNL